MAKPRMTRGQNMNYRLFRTEIRNQIGGSFSSTRFPARTAAFLSVLA
jgi:hypothetical protein